jgi:hypothetical protein
MDLWGKKKLFVGVMGLGAGGRNAAEMGTVQANSSRIYGCGTNQRR